MKSTFILLTAFLLSLGAWAQESTFATARIFESMNGSRIFLEFENGENQIYPMEDMKLLAGTGSWTRTMSSNQKTINRMIGDMKLRGFEIQHMSSSGESYIYTFIYFRKKAE